MAPSGSPVISVLLPVYNAQRYLPDAVESVLDQTFADFELIAFDDGSTDGSLQLLRNYAARDPRVRLFTRENRGLVATLNEMIGLANGRYLARMDADDICKPERFERQVSFLDSHADYVVVGGWLEWMNDRGQIIGTIKTPEAHEEIDAAHLKGHTSICHPAAMLRNLGRNAIDWYDEQCLDAEDLDLWLRLAEVGRLANIPEVVLTYRIHAESISEAKGQRQRDAMRRACALAWVRRGIRGHFEGNSHWRPGRDAASLHRFALQYGWTAWAQGHRDAWRSYAWQALRSRPFDRASWKLLIFGLFRRPRQADAVP
jgi:glycosyltransferase involved in cell wall biosynthesis